MVAYQQENTKEIKRAVLHCFTTVRIWDDTTRSIVFNVELKAGAARE